VFVTRRKQAIEHWQSQWHTERNGQLFFKFLVDFRSANVRLAGLARVRGANGHVKCNFKKNAGNVAVSPPLGKLRHAGPGNGGHFNVAPLILRGSEILS